MITKLSDEGFIIGEILLVLLNAMHQSHSR